MSRPVIRHMRGWVADSFDDAPDGLTEFELVAAVDRHYCGGVDQFIADGDPADGTNLIVTGSGHLICAAHALEWRHRGDITYMVVATEDQAADADFACCDCLADRLEGWLDWTP